jgi:hypothetical protein
MRQTASMVRWMSEAPLVTTFHQTIFTAGVQANPQTPHPPLSPQRGEGILIPSPRLRGRVGVRGSAVDFRRRERGESVTSGVERRQARTFCRLRECVLVKKK